MHEYRADVQQLLNKKESKKSQTFIGIFYEIDSYNSKKFSPKKTRPLYPYIYMSVCLLRAFQIIVKFCY